MTVKICVCFEKYLVKDIATVLRIQIPSSERLAVRIFVKVIENLLLCLWFTLL